MCRYTVLVLLALTSAAPTRSQTASAPQSKRAMVLDDLARLKLVGPPQVSPDGKWVAYTVSEVDTEADKSISHLWMVSWDGDANAGGAVQLTYGDESASAPRWSPDGKYLAFTSSRPGKAKGAQVWVLDRRGGEARQLTDVKEDLSEYRWSPDSRQLLLTLRQKEEPDDDKDKNGKPKPPKAIVIDRFHFKQDIEGYLTDKREHLFLFDIADKKLTKLTNDDKHEEQDAEWSPDGSHIAFVSKQEPSDPDRANNSDVFVVDAKAGSAPRKLTTYSGTDEGPLAWSPDSKLIVYRQGTAQKYSIYDMPRLAAIAADGGTPTLLTEHLDNWVTGPVLGSDGKTILTTIADDRVAYVSEVPLHGGAAKRLTADRGTAMAVSQAGGHVAVQWSTDAAPPEIYALVNGKLRKLTAHNDALIAQLDLAPTEDVSAKSKDGTDVHGLLTMPRGYKDGAKAPMLLRIHGGPTSQDAHAFSIGRQLFAAHGYAVLNVNYRGSTGRGHAYSEAINADWGDKEVQDLLASVDQAVSSGRVDPDRLGIGGWSYGGILTDYTIASDNRFKAASSGAGTGNMFSMYGVDEYILQYETELGPPWKDPQAWIKLSYPFFQVEKIKTPTLFMGGDKDFNVPLVGSEQMYEAMRSVGVTAELIVYPGQFHGFTQPSFIRDRYQRWFDWYDKYLVANATQHASTGQ